MTVALSGQNIIVSGTGAVHTWADIVAAGSTYVVAQTQTNGRTIYRLLGRITVQDSATLNITDVILDIFRDSATDPAQIRAIGSGIVNFNRCQLKLSARNNAPSTDSESRYLIRSNQIGLNITTARVTATNTQFFFSYENRQPDAKRVEVLLTSVSGCSFIGKSESVVSEGFFLGLPADASVENTNLVNVGIDLYPYMITPNISTVAGGYFRVFADQMIGFTNWTINGFLLRNLNIVPGSGSDYFSSTQWFTTFVDGTVNLANGTVMVEPLPPTGEHKRAYTSNLKLTDANGNIASALVTYTGRTTANATSNASGVVPEFTLIVQETNLAGMTPPGSAFSYTEYAKPLSVVDYSAYTFTIRSYGHLVVSQSLSITAPIGTPSFPLNFGMLIDDGVTETNTTTVSGYSGITNTTSAFTLSGSLTLNQVYDSRKLYWRNNSGVSVPVKNGSEANFGSANITINAPSNLPATTAKYTEFATTGTITLGAVGNYSATPFIAGASSVITVTPGGITDLRTWTIPSGATINRSSTGGATVIVASTAGITAGTGVTLQVPSVDFAAPNINNGGFDNVRCRTSLYLKVAFNNTNVNAGTNQITIAGSSGKITQNTIVRLAGTDLPAPLEPDQVFYPRTISGNAFTLSNQPGGAGSDIDLQDIGSGPMVVILTTELNNALVTSGGYTFSLNQAATTVGVTLAVNDSLLFQAIHWKGSLQTVSPAIASRYKEEILSYQGGNVLTLTQLEAYPEHNTFAVRQATDGYAISQLTVAGSSPTRYQWRVDASTPGKVQIESEDPDRVISTELALLYFQYMQWTLSGLRLFRGQIEAENLNSIVIKSPEAGLDADLTVEAYPAGVPLLVNGPGMYRADGKSWIATDSPGSIQHQPSALAAVAITVEKAVNLSPEVMQLLHSIAAGTAIATQATGGGGGGLDAAGVRSAIGLASANLDTQLSNIPSNVWGAATRTLSAGTNIVLAKGTGITGFNDIAATDVWAAATRTLSSGANIVLPNSQTFSTSGSVGSISGVTFPSNFGVLAIAPTTGLVSVGTNNDKTGYSLTQAFPTNFASLAITGGGAVTAGTVGDKTGYSLSGTQSFNLTGNITGNLSGSVGSVTGAVTLPSIPANWITAAGIATDAIDGDAIATSAVTEIQSGLATSSAVSAIPTNPLLTTDSRLNNLDAAISSRLASASYTAPPSVANIWGAATSGLTGVGTIGKLLADNVDATISSRSTYAGGDTAGTTTLLSRLTSGRATNLDNLDASISSRSTYAGGDTAGTTTLLNRLTSGRATNLDNLDATVSSRLSTAGYTAPPNASIATILTNTNRVDALITNPGGGDRFTSLALSNAPTGGGGSTPAQIWDYALTSITTAGSVGRLIKDNLDATVSSRSTYSGSDTAGTTTLLSRITSTRAGYIDNLSGGAPLLASSYVAPDNSTIATIGTRTARVDALITNPGGGDRFTSLALSNAPTGSGGGLDAAGVRAALGMAAANLDTQLSGISTGIGAIPTTAAPTVSQIWTGFTAGTVAANVINQFQLGLSTYGGGDTSGVTTLLNRLTSTRATNLDFLDAAITSRSTYSGGDTPGTTTLLSRIAGPVLLAANYTAPANSDIAAIKAKTDQLGFTSGNVNAIALAGSISVSAVANNAITADSLDATAIAEIQSGLATSSQVSANGFTGTDRTALLSTQSAALAVADGRQKINYLNSTFTLYNSDGSVRRVFNLRDQDNNAATSAATAIERVPQ